MIAKKSHFKLRNIDIDWEGDEEEKYSLQLITYLTLII